MRGDYARVTAADRPGVAQPVPVRPVPAQPWGRIMLAAVLILALLVGGWEAYWRAYGVKPDFANSYGLWAIQRRRIDNGEGTATVVVSDSRLFFDLQLPVWERLTGKRPIQLGFEGTSAREHLLDVGWSAWRRRYSLAASVGAPGHSSTTARSHHRSASVSGCPCI